MKRTHEAGLLPDLFDAEDDRWENHLCGVCTIIGIILLALLSAAAGYVLLMLAASTRC